MGTGCVGQRIAAILAQEGAAPQRLILKNLGGVLPLEGSVAQLYRERGLDGAGVAQTIEEILS